jgi:hypothetical protein
MKTYNHIQEIIPASRSVVIQAAKAWGSSNGFRISESSSLTHMSATTGCSFGITDRQTGRTMEVILNSVSEGTAVSIYHHTGRIFFVVGVVFSEILKEESNSFLSHVRDSINQSNQTIQSTPLRGATDG